MKRSLFGLVLLLGVAVAAPSFAAPAAQGAPYAAPQVSGAYVCPPGWYLVQSQQYVTYNMFVGYQNQLVWTAWGWRWMAVPVYRMVTQLVPANYCVPGYNPYPGPVIGAPAGN